MNQSGLDRKTIHPFLFSSTERPDCFCFILYAGWNGCFCYFPDVNHSSTKRIWEENGTMAVCFRHLHSFQIIRFYILQHRKWYDICLQYFDVPPVDNIHLCFCIWLAHCVFSISGALWSNKIRRSCSFTGTIYLFY